MYQRQSSYSGPRPPRARRTARLLTCALLAGSTWGCLAAEAPADGGAGEDDAADARRAGPTADMLPRFTEEGALLRPEGWEAWVLAGTSMGLTYNEPARSPAPGEPPGRFLNVYVQPWAYERFLETGAFAEGTMFILAGAEPVRKADPARGGFYQGELSLLEVHLKKEGVHESGWGFYSFGGGDAAEARLIPGEAACYSCHRDEAAFDHVFTQFYPSMHERLRTAAAAPSGAEGPGEDDRRGATEEAR